MGPELNNKDRYQKGQTPPSTVRRSAKHPKSLFTKEHLSLFYMSIGAGFATSTILTLTAPSPTMASATGFCISIIVFLGFAKLNNRHHRVDKEQLENLALVNSFETIDYLAAFNADIVNTVAALDQNTSLKSFFSEIFKEEAAQKVQLLLKTGDVIRFVAALSAIDRERIYRFYLVTKFSHVAPR